MGSIVSVVLILIYGYSSSESEIESDYPLSISLLDLSFLIQIVWLSHFPKIHLLLYINMRFDLEYSRIVVLVYQMIQFQIDLINLVLIGTWLNINMIGHKDSQLP